MKDVSEFHSAATTGTSLYIAFIAGVPAGLPLKTGHVYKCSVWIASRHIIFLYSIKRFDFPNGNTLFSVRWKWSLITICRPFITQTVDVLSPRRPWFNSRPVHTRDVGRVALGHVNVTRANGRLLRTFHKAKRSHGNLRASDRKLL